MKKSNSPISNYGNGSNMDDVVKIIRKNSKVFDTLQKNVKTILSINCGDAVCEQYVIEKLFPYIKNVIHTDIIIPSNNKNRVIKKSAATALKNHVTDLVLCFFPRYNSKGYSNIIDKCFKAKYLIFLGEFREEGHCDPAELISQIKEEMDILLCEQINYFMGIKDHIVVCEMKENEQRRTLESEFSDNDDNNDERSFISRIFSKVRSLYVY